MFRDRISIDEIATKHGMSILAVGKAIQRVEEHHYVNSDEMVRVAFNETVLNSVKDMGKVLVGAMGAKIETHEKTGKVGKERWVKKSRPDHATRLKAVETAKGIFESTQPKGGGVNIALQQNNGGGETSGNSPTKTFDFEARLRTIRERKGLTNKESDVVDGEYEDEESDELADELAEIGIELDEDEDEDNENLK